MTARDWVCLTATPPPTPRENCEASDSGRLRLCARTLTLRTLNGVQGRQRWLYGALALGISVPLVGAVALLKDASNESGVAGTTIVECLSVYEAQKVYTQATDCLDDLSARASSAKQAPELIRELAQVRYAEQIEEGLCHDVAHQLGEYEMERLAYDVPTMMETMPALPCTSGVLHGALIAWGETRPDPKSRDTVAGMCRDLAHGLTHPDSSVPYHDFEGMQVDCADGYGHAMWEASDDDPAEALEYCRALADDELIYYCALGVGMQGAEATPVGPGPVVTLDQARVEVAAWCAEQQGALRRGCAAMLSIPFGAELDALAWKAEGPASTAEMENAARTTIGYCQELAANDLQEACLTELTSHTIGQFDGHAAWLCPLMPAKQVRSCRDLLRDRGVVPLSTDSEGAAS